MLSRKKLMRHLLLATWSCFLLVTLSAPVLSHLAVTAIPQTSQATPEVQFLAGAMLDENVVAARSVFLAQGMSNESMMTYGTVLSQQNVVPKAPTSEARGAVGAVLVGDRLVVRSSFSNLSSPMRDYTVDPVNPPNPNITSAFHIHQGMPAENGPFQYALTVMMDDTGRGGSAMGEYTLTPDQLQALADGKLYLDLHTTQNRGGELRGILMPYG